MSKEDTKVCCKDEQKQVKLQTDQKTAETFSLPVYFSSDIDVISFIQYQPTFHIAQSLRHPYSNAPPDKGSSSLYLRNNVFRI